MVNDENYITNLIIVITLIFLIAPAFVMAYIFVYNRRKKAHIEEKELMKLTFDAELIKTQYEAREQTMQTIGADLHDNIGQLLSLTSLTLNSVELDNVEKARQKIDAAIDLTLRSIKEMRQLGKLLQGDQLIVLGLTEAIRHEVNWMERSGKYEINYLVEEGMPATNNPDKDLILFRILQEILNNIIKHSMASVIDIQLKYHQECLLQLQIGDNGVGFDLDNMLPEQKGMGLQNIKKRVGIVGGNVTISSIPDKGTSINIYIPYP